MLNTINVLPGSYIEIVPLGLLCTLQYNSSGILQRILLNYEETNYNDGDIMDPDLTIKLKQQKIVPQRIPFKQGTTWVKGVFYTKKQFKSEGILPKCLENEILTDLKSNIGDYTFYAGHMKNDSFNFAGASLIATRLRTFGFTVLPGYIIYDIRDNSLPIYEIMKAKRSPFEYPLISGVICYDHGVQYRYISTGLKQCKVQDTVNFLDPHGYMYTKIHVDSRYIDKSYTDIVKFDVQPKSVIILDEDEIVYSKKPNTLFHHKLSRDIHCNVCGKVLQVPIRGYTVCRDEHCVSKLYPLISHFTKSLLLPDMSFESFQHHVDNKDITCLTDVLLLDEYKDLEINCTLSTLLYAVVPFELCRGVQFFQEFVNYLGSIEALDYYIQNPESIVSDLNLNKRYAQNFSNWLKDPYNVVDLDTFLKSDQIHIQPVSKKFDGAPIFRGKTICITGQFRYGTLEDIISILQSYSAKVVTRFDNTVNCVIVGHFEGEDSKLTELAMSYNVPIYGEDDFFRSYEIDMDLKNRIESTSYLK